MIGFDLGARKNGGSRRAVHGAPFGFSLTLASSRSPFVLVSVCCFIFLTVSPLFAQSPADIQQLRKRRIEAVIFQGNNTIVSEELQAVVVTYHAEWYERFIDWLPVLVGVPTQYIAPDVLDADTLRLISYYRRRGYLDVKAFYTIREDSASAAEWQHAYDRYRLSGTTKPPTLPDVIDTVIFSIYEGTRYRIDHFAVEGLEHIDTALADQLTRQTLLRHDTPYTEQALLAEARRVETILRENGYAFFTSPRDSSRLVYLDRDHKTVNVNLVYKTGPRVRNGDLVVNYDSVGKKRGTLNDAVLRKSIELKRGEWYRYSDLANSERNLGGLGVFDNYRVELDTMPYAGRLDNLPEGTALPVKVYLRMQSTADLTPGFFAGFGGSSRGAFGFSLAYNNHSAFGGAENLALQGSLQAIPWLERKSIYSQLSLPYVFGRSPLNIFANLSSVTIADLYQELIAEGVLSTTFLLSRPGTIPRITYSPVVTFEYVDRTDNTGIAIDTTVLTRRQINLPVDFLNLTVDWSNDPLNPSSGSIVSAALQQAWPIQGFTSLPSAAYTKLSAQAKTYFDLSHNGLSVVGLRASVGSIILADPSNPDRDIPIERRLFGGGPNSLRGWGSRGIVVSNDSAHSPLLGGYRSLEANIEWRYAPFHYPIAITSIQKFLTDVRIAFFMDAGNVWDRDLSPSLKECAIDAGFGIHYNTMIGVVRLDIGMKLYDPDPSSTGDKPMFPAAEGVWIWNRHFNFWDLSSFQFALGQSF